MKQSRFSLFNLIWMITSGAVFALALGAQLFFSLSDYGFLYNHALLWLCLGSFLVLLAGVMVWLCRHKVKVKALAIIACVVLSILATIVFFGTLLLSIMGGDTATKAGSISGNLYYVNSSPQGSNRFVIMFTGMDSESIYAYPMQNRWIYKEIDNGFVWEGELQQEEYTVEWPSEKQAIVQVLRSRESVDGENPDGRIIVDFEG